MNRIIYIALLFLVSAASVSCIREDDANCPVAGEQNILFVYQANGSDNVFNSYIRDVSMYVFDNDDSLIDIKSYKAGQLSGHPGVSLDLEDGSYTLIMWGSYAWYHNGIVYENGGRRVTDYYLGHIRPEGNPPRSSDHLYYARYDLTIENDSGRDHTAVFSSAHIDFELKIEGLDNIPDRLTPAELVLNVDNVADRYDFFFNEIGSPISYIMNIPHDSSRAETEFSTYRFADQNDIAITLSTAEGDELCFIDLEEFMTKYKISVEGINEVLISINVRFNSSGVSISVNDWDDNTTNPIV